MDSSSLSSRQASDAPVARVLIPRHQIAARVAELAAEIAACYRGGELTILAVLTGAVVFLSDLIRHLPLRIRLETVRVLSYPDRATVSQGPSVLAGPTADLGGQEVLVLDDILDSGQTLQAICAMPAFRRAASLRTCVLLRKQRCDLSGRAEPDFVGFDVEDHFVVGYGLDYGDLYRNLPDICILRDPLRGGRDGE
jgi:hypoxanthine phosphoribosyltransferase